MNNGMEENHLAGWKEFVSQANEFISSGTFKNDVSSHWKMGRKIAGARDSVLRESDNWAESVKKNAFAGKAVFFMVKGDFLKWVDGSSDDAASALRAIWTEDSLPLEQRIRTFCERIPKKQVGGGTGTHTSIVAQLLIGLDSEKYTPFSIKKLNRAYGQTGYDLPNEKADEAALYIHALGFLDRLIEEARERGLELRNRPEAFVVVWHLVDVLPNLSMPPNDCDSLADLANELLLEADFLEEIETLLEDKRQIIFQGPPGTGKTYVARAFADYLAVEKNRVKMVQFHPSYAYEDFVRGFRPTSKEGSMAGFELQDGPLLEVAKDARNDNDSRYILIIDEINRGNLAKVFGELYFLLEYRDAKITLQYQLAGEEEFSLPRNLYIIGTMNTADRSIALVDLALRRRFEFVPFHPDEEPVKSVLRKWLQRQLRKGRVPENIEWVADVVEEANKLLDGYKHAAIGPSYFMKDGLNEKVVRRAWKYSVLPYIEELLFGDERTLEDFNLDRLIQKVRQKQTAEKDGEGAEGKSDEKE